MCGVTIRESKQCSIIGQFQSGTEQKTTSDNVHIVIVVKRRSDRRKMTNDIDKLMNEHEACNYDLPKQHPAI